MAKGNYLVRGDKTTCGGVIVEGCEDHCLFGNAIAREADKVTCGIFPGMFNIVGGIENDSVHGRRMAGTLDSVSSCPCRSRFIASMENDTYEKIAGMQNEPEQYGQSVKKDEKDSNNLNLNYKITLSGRNILTPLAIPNYEEMTHGGRTKNTEKIKFLITNSGDEVDGISLEVLDGSEIIYSERCTSEFFSPGEHVWYWDGYSNEGTLDTRKLKSKRLIVRLIALKEDKMIKVDYLLNNTPEEQDWVDVRVNRNTQTVDVFWRVAFSDGGVDGSNPLLQPLSYSDLQRKAKEGIEFYWSRNGSRQPGIGDNISTAQGVYKVTVTVNINESPSMPSFELIEVLGAEYGRSTSLKLFRKVNHNTGYYYAYMRGIEEAGYQYADGNFKLVAAHEMGHIVLDEYGKGSSPDYSWSHKGTSTVITQDVLPVYIMPPSGEIDLMKYIYGYGDDQQEILRSVADSIDVQGLIWLSRVKIDD